MCRRRIPTSEKILVLVHSYSRSNMSGLGVSHERMFYRTFPPARNFDYVIYRRCIA
jgi:outer membrane protein assembly factor BamD (BamD/ComL family)